MNETKKINTIDEATKELFALGLTFEEIELLKEKLFINFAAEVRNSFYYEVDTCKMMSSCIINPEDHSDHHPADQSEDGNGAR